MKIKTISWITLGLATILIVFACDRQQKSTLTVPASAPVETAAKSWEEKWKATIMAAQKEGKDFHASPISLDVPLGH